MEHGPLVIKVAKTVEEMSEGIAGAIRYLDSHIFEKSLPVATTDNPAFYRMGPAGFLIKNWFFRLIGFKDEYLVFTKSHQAEELRVRPYGIVGVALHEVRHRYQKTNSKCLITLNFTRDHRLHFNQEIVDLAVERGKQYKNNSMRKMEFDAAMIEWIFNLHYSKKTMNHSMILKLVTCDESSILKIISDLKYL